MLIHYFGRGGLNLDRHDHTNIDVGCNMKYHNAKEDSVGDTMEIKSPSEIGYYGRSITTLNRDELISAITELAIMYKECKMNSKN